MLQPGDICIPTYLFIQNKIANQSHNSQTLWYALGTRHELSGCQPVQTEANVTLVESCHWTSFQTLEVREATRLIG